MRAARFALGFVAIFVPAFVSACSGETPEAATGGAVAPASANAEGASWSDDGGASLESAVPTTTAVTADVCDPLSPRASALEVAALPEAGEAPFVDALASAQSTIRVMVYLMGYGGILDTLKAKAQSGVAVKVILDVGQRDVNQKYKTLLEAAGAEVHWSDARFPYMHAKVLIADSSAAVLSTGNYARSFMLKERNFVATDRDPKDLESLTALFDADFAGTESDLSCTRFLVSPTNARARLVDFIRSAQTSLLVESMQFADPEVRDAVIERARSGVAVRVLLAQPSWITANTRAFSLLARENVPAKTRPYLHAKAIVVDSRAAYLGSENLSSTSLDRNREVGILTEDVGVVETMTRTFEGDWAIGTTP